MGGAQFWLLVEWGRGKGWNLTVGRVGKGGRVETWLLWGGEGEGWNLTVGGVWKGGRVEIWLLVGWGREEGLKSDCWWGGEGGELKSDCCWGGEGRKGWNKNDWWCGDWWCGGEGRKGLKSTMLIAGVRLKYTMLMGVGSREGLNSTMLMEFGSGGSNLIHQYMSFSFKEYECNSWKLRSFAISCFKQNITPLFCGVGGGWGQN